MNDCAICHREQTHLADYDTDHGIVGICSTCVRALIDKALDEQEQAMATYCAPCCHYTADGHCKLGLAPKECC